MTTATRTQIAQQLRTYRRLIRTHDTHAQRGAGIHGFHQSLAREYRAMLTGALAMLDLARER